jgi:cytochrome c-type biogenesis protein CcmH
MKQLILILMLLGAPVWAVEPDEILDDPVLEQRARDLSKGLRCLVCQNESIDESNATLARDLRLLVRERLVAGDSDEAAVEYIVARYGEFVLLNPPVTGANWLLWGAGPLMLLLAGGVGFAYLRGRSPARARTEQPLSESEQARLDDILGR